MTKSSYAPAALFVVAGAAIGGLAGIVMAVAIIAVATLIGRVL